MIICHDLMVQLGLVTDFNNKYLAWDDDVVPMKDTRNLLGKTNLTKCDIKEVVTHT